MENSTDRSIITNDYESLWFDEYDILFCGKNNIGETIIGSLYEEGDEDVDYVITLIHSIVDESILKSLRLGKQGGIPYLEVLKNAKIIYRIKTKYGKNPLSVTEIKFEDIPEDGLPKDYAFLPIKN